MQVPFPFPLLFLKCQMAAGCSTAVTNGAFLSESGEGHNLPLLPPDPDRKDIAGWGNLEVRPHLAEAV